MTKEQIEALEGLIEDVRMYMHEEYHDYIEKFITKIMPDEYHEKWNKDKLKNIQILEDMLLTHENWMQ